MGDGAKEKLQLSLPGGRRQKAFGAPHGSRKAVSSGSGHACRAPSQVQPRRARGAAGQADNLPFSTAVYRRRSERWPESLRDSDISSDGCAGFTALPRQACRTTARHAHSTRPQHLTQHRVQNWQACMQQIYILHLIVNVSHHAAAVSVLRFDAANSRANSLESPPGGLD